MADGELQVALVPDEQALENIEEKQLEISGEPDSVGEAKELNESQDQRMAVANRKLGRITTRLGQLGLIAAGIAALTKIIGEIFNIGFEDVRNAIVEAINLVVDTIKSFLPGGNISQPPTATETSSALATGLPGLIGGNPGIALGSLLGSRASDVNRGKNEGNGQNVNMVTSRDMLLGDSTFREMSSEKNQFFTIEGGS